jgi:hypothetical protein
MPPTSRNAPPPLIAAGFTGINAAVVSLDKEVPDAAGFARAATYGNLLSDQIRTRGGVEPELIVGALAREYRREFGADPGRMPLQAIVFSEKKDRDGAQALRTAGGHRVRLDA